MKKIFIYTIIIFGNLLFAEHSKLNDKSFLYNKQEVNLLLSKKTSSSRLCDNSNKYYDIAGRYNIFFYMYKLYEIYLKNHNEKKLLKYWDKWSYISRFYYDNQSQLRIIKHYYPNNDEWHECQIFVYTNFNVLKEQYCLQQWVLRDTGKKVFSRHKHIYLYLKDKTEILNNLFNCDKTIIFYKGNKIDKISEVYKSKTNPSQVEFYYSENKLDKIINSYGYTTLFKYNKQGLKESIEVSYKKEKVRYWEKYKYISENSIKYYHPCNSGCHTIYNTITYTKDGNPKLINLRMNELTPSEWKFYYVDNPNYKKE